MAAEPHSLTGLFDDCRGLFLHVNNARFEDSGSNLPQGRIDIP